MSRMNQPGISPEAVEKRMKAAEAALKRMQENPRITKVVVVVPDDACPACMEVFGTYEKDNVPRLPMDACSHPLGCRAYYQPFIDELYP